MFYNDGYNNITLVATKSTSAAMFSPTDPLFLLALSRGRLYWKAAPDALPLTGVLTSKGFTFLTAIDNGSLTYTTINVNTGIATDYSVTVPAAT